MREAGALGLVSVCLFSFFWEGEAEGGEEDRPYEGRKKRKKEVEVETGKKGGEEGWTAFLWITKGTLVYICVRDKSSLFRYGPGCLSKAAEVELWVKGGVDSISLSCLGGCLRVCVLL